MLGSCFPLPVQQSSSEAHAFRLGIQGGKKLQEQTLHSYLSCFHQTKPIAPKLPRLPEFHTHGPFSSKSVPFCTKPSLKNTEHTLRDNCIYWGKAPTSLLLHLQECPQFCHRAKPQWTAPGGGEQLSEPAGLCSPCAEMPQERKRQWLSGWNARKHLLSVHTAELQRMQNLLFFISAVLSAWYPAPPS